MSSSYNKRRKDSYGGYAHNHSKSRRRRQRNQAPLFLAAIAAVIIIAAIAFLLKHSGNKTSETQAAEESETVNRDIIAINAYIDLSEVLPEGTPEESLKLSVRGMTPQEISGLVAEKYKWNLKITNDQANVGAKVLQTVAADATTEAATMGDAENPDGINSSETETEAEDESVSNSIEVPDLINKALTELIDRMSADSEAAVDSGAAETLPETTEKKKGLFSRKESESQTETETEAENAEYYVLSLGDYEAEITEVVSKAASMWYIEPHGESIGSYDKSTDKFIMEGAKTGYRVDEEKLKSELLNAISSKSYDTSINVPGEKISANSNITVGDYKTLATFTTNTTSNSVRNKNVQLACEALNGTIVRPGEEFSFNNTVGQRTEEKGYGAAAAYNNGEVVQEVGGGVCQVSTTLYNAVVKAGLKVTGRQSHTFKPTYVTPGQDATISWGGPDFKFANMPAIAKYSNSESYAIGIRASYSNQTVTVSIYGRPVLKDGYSYSLSSEQIKELDIVRELIQPGSDKTPTTGTKGSVWETRLVIKKDGEIISNEVDHKAYYAGHKEYYTDETSAAESESSAESESETTGQESTSAAEGPGGQAGPGGTSSGVIGPEVSTTESENRDSGNNGNSDGPPTDSSGSGADSGPGGTGGQIQDGPGALSE